MSALQGSCLCNGVQYTVTGEPEASIVCYCTDCKKNAGAPFQMGAKFDKSAINITEGEDLIGTWIVKQTHSGNDKHKQFCKRCGCTLWTKPMAYGGDKFVVRTSLIDGGIDKLKPKAEYYTSLRPDFMQPYPNTKQYATMP